MEFYKLKKLQAENFRNLEASVIDFNGGINCIFGLNGNGKTNILEAIYFLCHKKSFRKNTSFPQILNVNCGKPQVILSSLLLDQNDKHQTFSAVMNSQSHSWSVNGKQVKTRSKFGCVFINPFDSYGFHSVPSFRRNWVDQHLALISKEYKHSISRHTQVLKFRNSLLSNGVEKLKEQLEAIDQQLSLYSKVLTDLRRDLLKQLSPYCKKTFKIIFEENHDLQLVLNSKFEGLSQYSIKQYYEKNIDRDISAGRTTYGVHLDDYTFEFDGFNSFEFCSLGQQKMSFLSLIFAYIELFRYKYGAYPIVLIDDVSGELDSRRWKNLIGYLEAKKFQVIITTANESFREELQKIENSNKIYVENGIIKN